MLRRLLCLVLVTGAFAGCTIERGDDALPSAAQLSNLKYQDFPERPPPEGN
jgi:hypothetical protein